MARTTAASGKPPLYGKPIALDANTHRDWKIAQTRDFAFAEKANSLPLTAVEFPSAARSFPIVFGLDAPHTPLCILGLQQPVNLFLDERSQWDPLAYIPAYVRRYPFLYLKDSKEPTRQILGIDSQSTLLGPQADGERLMLDDGKPSPFLDTVVEFCNDFNRQWTISLALSAALFERGLLVEESSTVTFPDQREVKITGFLTIDEQRLNELPAELFVEWRDRGWLAPIYAVLASKLNWNMLGQRTARPIAHRPSNRG